MTTRKNQNENVVTKKSKDRRRYQAKWAKKKRQELKDNPKDYEEYKAKEREIWCNRQTENRTDCQFKERLRVYMQKYREKMKAEGSSESSILKLQTVSRQVIVSRKRILRNRSKTVRELERHKNLLEKKDAEIKLLRRKI